MKTCKDCNELKSLDDFGKSGRSSDGYTYQCRLCLAKRQAEWRAKNPQRSAAIEHKSWNEKQKFSKHGLTKEAYYEIYNSQNGLCAICGRAEEDRPKGGLFIDHNHECCPRQFSCGKCIRGLLCMKCNTAISFLNDSPTQVRRAAEYLESPVLALTSR